jgi:hypothetical protein
VSENTRPDPAGKDLRHGDHVCALYLGNRAGDEVDDYVTLIVGGMALENPHHPSPDEFLAARE